MWLGKGRRFMGGHEVAEPVLFGSLRRTATQTNTPKPNSLTTDFNPALIQQIFHIPERKGEPEVEHHHKEEDVVRHFKTMK